MKITEPKENKVEKKTHIQGEVIQDTNTDFYYMVVYDENDCKYKQINIKHGIIIDTSWDSLEEMDEKCPEDIYVDSHIEIINKGFNNG